MEKKFDQSGAWAIALFRNSVAISVDELSEMQKWLSSDRIEGQAGLNTESVEIKQRRRVHSLTGQR